MSKLNRFWPSSMTAQMLLGTLFALLMALLISLLILGGAYRTVVTEINQKSLFRRFESLMQLLESTEEKNYHAVLMASRSNTAWFTVDKQSIVNPAVMTPRERHISNRFLKRLGDQYQGKIRIAINDRSSAFKKRRTLPADNPLWGTTLCLPWEMCSGERLQLRNGMDRSKRDHKKGFGAAELTRLKISARLGNGLWLNLKASTQVAPPLAPGQTVVFLVVSSVLVLLGLLLMIRRITRPLRLLSKASHRLGAGEAVEALPENGPEDVRETIRAFNQMNSKIQRFLSDRTHMLAALSHDLRTPITILRLRVELMPESKDKAQLLVILEEMQAMSEVTLAFIRQSSNNEKNRSIELNAMLSSLCDDLAELGQPVSFIEGDNRVLNCRPVSLKRAFRNLIENGLKYGEQVSVRLIVEHSGDKAVVEIQDQGPGIADEYQEKVFEPFARLEGSRNRDTGGIGLGMAIARDIVRNHGGDIQLVNNDQGLLVRVYCE